PRSALFPYTTLFRSGILVLGIWSLLAPLSGAVIAPGFVKIDLNRKVVQHQEGGIVSAIRVRDGDRVKAGQELIVLMLHHLAVERSEEHTSELQSRSD